jgi:hypothetical protein
MNEDAIDRKLVCAFIDGLISDDREREKGLEYTRSMPPVNPTKTGWIPVSERLPEDGKWAIFTDGKNISVERFKLDAISHFFPNGRWFELEDAIAWMPLPKPYEPQERSEKE